MVILSDFLWKMSFLQSAKIPEIMINYNHSKINKTILTENECMIFKISEI